MIVSCSTYGHRFLSFEKAIERLAGLGFKALDIMGTRPHLLPDDYTKEEIEKIREILAYYGIKVSAVTPFDGHPQWHLTASNERHRRDTIDHVKKCIQVAAVLESKVVQCITGMPLILDVPFTKAWNNAKQGLLECAKHAEEHGVVIALEGEENNVVRTSSDTLRMIQEVEHPNLQALLEIGHANMMATDDPMHAIEILKDKIVHCHAHDNHGMTDEHLVPGDGIIDWESVLGALSRTGYRGYVALEILVPNPDGGALRGKRHLEERMHASGS